MKADLNESLQLIYKKAPEFKCMKWLAYITGIQNYEVKKCENMKRIRGLVIQNKTNKMHFEDVFVTLQDHLKQR